MIFPKLGEFIFPIADGRIRTSGGDQDLRTSTLVRHRPIQGESNIDFLGESEGSLPQPHDSLPDASEAINDFWSMPGNFIYRHHVEPRVKLYSPREESFPVPLKFIDVPRTTRTNLDVMQESRIDYYWKIDGSRELSDSWTRFTQFTPSREKPLEVYMWSGWRLTKRQVTVRPDLFWPELWTKLRRNAKLREKHKLAIGKPKLDNVRRLRGIYFIDPEDMKFKEIIENARRKLEARLARKTSILRPVARLVISGQNLRVSWKPVNPPERVWKNLYRVIVRTISQLKETLNYSITTWYPNLFLCTKQ